MKIEIEVSSQRIADLMTSAIEGGSTYWCGGVYLRSPAKRRGTGEEGYPWYARKATYEDPDLVIEVVEDENGMDEGRHMVTQAELRRGLLLMAGEKWGHHLGHILNENWDAADADLFLQLVALGDEVYG